jgi:two-component system sensor histidine kinase QseC
MKNSLRMQLLAGTLAIVVVVWLGLGLFAWREAQHEADELFDAHLAQTAALLSTLVNASDRHDAEDFEEHLPSHHYARKVAFQVWEKGSRLLVHSPNAPADRLSSKDDGFDDADIAGQGWRVYSLWDRKQNLLVQVGETQEARTAIGREMAKNLLLPLAIALPLLALALIVLIGGRLAPLSRMAESIGQRSPDRLDAIPLAGAPRELHPVLDRLNALFARIGVSMEQERRFTADAAHELRTPLAAMRTHAQVALASRAEGEREAALVNVIAATDRATHLLEQLLMLARLDSTVSANGFETCDLRGLATDAVARAAPAAMDKDIELELQEGDAVAIRGQPTLLAVLMRNLIDNAVRYSPGGGRVRVAVTSHANGAVLEVTDSGPGIAAEERTRVLDRFYRITGSAESGSGLGLSIVARIAELHGAALELADNPDGHGLVARVKFSSRS